jgi:hypothetical protein
VLQLPVVLPVVVVGGGSQNRPVEKLWQVRLPQHCVPEVQVAPWTPQPPVVLPVELVVPLGEAQHRVDASQTRPPPQLLGSPGHEPRPCAQRRVVLWQQPLMQVLLLPHS